MKTEIERIKARHPIESLVESYGIELKPSGRALVGRCFLHLDSGRPNLYVYPDTASWYCYRCCVGGDVIDFVRLIEQVGFREAVERLEGDKPAPATRARTQPARPARRPRCGVGPPDEEAYRALSAAVEYYRNSLLLEPSALGYATERGVSKETLDRLHVGYCAGTGLLRYLSWLHIPERFAWRAGLLRRGEDGRTAERLSGRVVVPEMRRGRPVWLVGRAWDPPDAEPKYLGIGGRKPLLGWERVQGCAELYLTEGVFDFLALTEWGYPAVGMAGTHLSTQALEAMGSFERVYLALDSDEAGREASHRLAAQLGWKAVEMRLPAKDVAEMALRPDGGERFQQAVQATKTAKRSR